MKKYVKTPLMFQMEATECGAVSLAIVLSCFGKHVPIEKLRALTGVSRDGCNAENIVRAAGLLGLHGAGYEIDIEQLEDMELPCIIHWNFNHFVVYEGRRGRFHYINDPAVGRRRLTQHEVDQCFTGIVLEFSKTEAFVPEKADRGLIGLIRERLAGQRSYLLLLSAAGVLMVLPGIVLPVLTQVFVDNILLRGQLSWMGGFAVIFVGILLFQMIFMLYRGFVLNSFQNRLVLLSSHEFLYHMLRLPMNFYEQRYPGDLSERIRHNNEVCEFLSGELTRMALDIFTAAFYLVLMFLYSGRLSLLTLFCTALYLGLMRFGSYRMQDDLQRQKQDDGKLTGAVFAGVSISKTLKASGAEHRYTGRILGYCAKSINREQKIGLIQELLTSGAEVVPQIISVTVLFAGAALVTKQSFSQGMLLAFMSLLAAFLQPMMKLSEFARQIQEFRVNAGRMDDILHYERDGRFADERRTAEEELQDYAGKLSGQLSVEALTFGYLRLGEPLLKDFSFRLECGSSIAIVGSSGSGKSTVSKLLGGLYVPWSGSIAIDGIPVQEIPGDILCASVATVNQEITLFSGTIRENLTMWSTAALEIDIIRAAKDACIHDEILKKPGSYSYMIKENGRNLSGGQRQRLEIARALVKNPAILIMDEATSALDALTEKQILNHIKRRGCTCVVIAHRLSAIRDCDEILMLEHGRITARGTHEELYEGFAPYREMVMNG